MDELPCLILLASLVCVIQVLSSDIPTGVLVNTPLPQQGSQVVFTCRYTIASADTLTQVLWSFGGQQSGSTKIGHWTYDDPDFIFYYPSNGYGIPKYRVLFDDVLSGESSLVIYPVALHDTGRYWCKVAAFGNSGEAYANIEVRDGTPTTAHTTTHGVPASVLDHTVSLATPVASNLRVSVKIEDGTTLGYLGEKLTANCDYSYNPGETVLSIGWQIGAMQGVLTPVASYTPVIGQVLRYTHEDYQPPAYIMRVNSMRSGQGRSTFTIQAVNLTDAQTYWCKVTLMSGASDIDSVSITISALTTTIGISATVENQTLSLTNAGGMSASTHYPAEVMTLPGNSKVDGAKPISTDLIACLVMTAVFLLVIGLLVICFVKQRSKVSTKREESIVKSDVVENQYQGLRPALREENHTYASPTMLQFTSPEPEYESPEYEIPELYSEYAEIDNLVKSKNTDSPYMELKEMTMNPPSTYQALND